MVSCARGQAETYRSGGCHYPATGSWRHCRAMWLALSPSMRGGSGCCRANLCGPSHITMGWSCIISSPTISRRPPFLRTSVRGTWGSSPTRSCGSTSSRRSTLPRRRARREFGERCTPEAALSKCRWVEVISTSRPSFSLNSGWHDGWFYLSNDDDRLPCFTGQVLMS
jgi:hypothetical protein